jgi:thiosulfate/3-mercaptopyruvate sulfurtransferase
MTMSTQPLVLLLLALAPGQAKADTYPRADLLMEPAELARPEVAKRYSILDTRPKKQYEAGHIPGAVWVDPGAWSKAYNDDHGGKLRSVIGKAGVEPTTPVVVYGGPMNEAARVWWLLHARGVKNARILNGGWKGWLAAGNKVSTKEKQPWVALWRLSIPRKRHWATKGEILKGLKKNAFQIVDARSEGEHCGTVTLAKRGGSIPGAINLEWTELLDRKTGRFKGAAELRQLFNQAGIRLNRPTVTYCQSGGRAAVMAFALELMGASDVRNYYRSWAEWGNADDTPVERPKAKKGR